MLEQIQTLMQNPIFGGIVGGSLITGVVFFVLKTIPLKIYSWIKYLFSYSLTFSNDYTDYDKIELWIHQKVISKKTKNIKISNTQAEDGPAKTLSYGSNFFWYKWHPVFVSKTRIENQGNGGWNSKLFEQITLKTFGVYNGFIIELLNEISAFDKRDNSLAVKFHNKDGNYCSGFYRTKRSLQSVILNNNIKNDIVTDLTKFIDNKEHYIEKGIPYKRNYILKGPPGTGKSSLLFALACKLNQSIFYLNLNSLKNDADINNFIGAIGKSIVVIEDIDRFYMSKTENQDDCVKECVSLSAILNMLDGGATPEGLITFITTNHYEKLDEALTRPGRIDKIYELNYFEKPEAEEMTKLFLKPEEVDDFINSLTLPIIPAELQEKLISLTEFNK